MKHIIFILALLFSISHAQYYGGGELIPLDSTFSDTDSLFLTNLETGLDSIPSKTGVVTYYSPMINIGKPLGKYDIAFIADSNGVVGDTPYLQLFARHLFQNDEDAKTWGPWHKVYLRKEAEFATATTLYDSLTYDVQYVGQYKHGTYLKFWHQSNGLQYKATTLDTFAVKPKLQHWIR